MDCVGPAMEAGEDKLIRETCRTRHVEVTTTEKVTVTEREKLKEVTTAEIIIETREVMNEVTELAETREIEETRSEVTETKDEHTPTELAEDDEGELAKCLVTRCEQLDSLHRERRETLCSLEADRDQVSSVVSSELEGASAVNGCTRGLEGMEALEPIVVARIPSVVTSVVPVCVFTSVVKCVLQRTHSVGEWRCVTETPCVEDPVCEWCGCECAKMRAFQHAVYERSPVYGRDPVYE